VFLNGATELALTKLDVLSEMGTLKVCTAYESEDGNHFNNLLPSAALDTIKPIYEEVPGWDADLSGIGSYSELPDAVKAFIDRIEAYVGVPVSLVSVGPGREQTIRRGDAENGW
jgi:adenylosuccinate synthase